MNKVVIFGTGSFAELVHFYLTHDSEYEVVAFTETPVKKDELFGLPVLPFETIDQKFPPDSYKMFVAVGYVRMNKIRAEYYEQAKHKGYELITYISSKCTCWTEAIGDNCFIFEDNTVQPFVTIGNNVIMWSGNHIGHHSTIGDHCFLASHIVISGHVQIGSHCFFGVNATVRDSISIGEFCLVGAGALIMKSTKDKEVFLGERTQPFRRNSDEINF